MQNLPFSTFIFKKILTDKFAYEFSQEWKVFKSMFFPQSTSSVYCYTSSHVLSLAQTLINSVALRSERGGAGGRFEYTNDNHLSNKSKRIRTAMDAEREEGREGNGRRWKNGGWKASVSVQLLFTCSLVCGTDKQWRQSCPFTQHFFSV